MKALASIDRFMNWKVLALALAAGSLLAQPPMGGHGHFGFGPEFGPAGAKTITGAPFSGTWSTQTVQALANGNQIQHQMQSTVYRDSQGRVRTDTTMTHPGSSATQPQTEITIHDPVAGYVYRLHPGNMTGTQMAIHQRPAQTSGTAQTGNMHAHAHAHEQGQVQTQDLGTQMINGVTATGTQVTRTIPAGTFGNAQAIQIVRTTWVSTALQIPVQITMNDPRMGVTTMNLTNIVQAEPDAGLFTAVSGYKISTPKAMWHGRPAQ